jgi:hypothetical protein
MICVHLRYSGNAKYRDNFWDDGNGADKLDATDVDIPLLVVGTKLVCSF